MKLFIDPVLIRDRAWQWVTKENDEKTTILVFYGFSVYCNIQDRRQVHSTHCEPFYHDWFCKAFLSDSYLSPPPTMV